MTNIVFDYFDQDKTINAHGLVFQFKDLKFQKSGKINKKARNIRGLLYAKSIYNLKDFFICHLYNLSSGK